MDVKTLAIVCTASFCVIAVGLGLFFKRANDTSDIDIDFDNAKLKENKLRF